ncbi:hypothetical protein KO531_22045 [Shewanella sp. NKUCC06_TVS]|nr:hypothetical protein [Shewanella sp. NKUCC06_TVS]
MPISSTSPLPYMSNVSQNLTSEKLLSDLKTNIKQVRNLPNGVIYSPFNNEDMVIQAIGINTARVLNGKQPLPMICSMLNRGALKSTISDVKSTELSGRLKDGAVYENKMTSYIKAIGIKDVHAAFPSEIKRLGEYQSLNQLEVIDPKSLPDNSIKNIYVIGHGEAGRPHLYETVKCGSASKSIDNVMCEIHSLVRQKANADVKIKMTACESADRETLQSFKQTNDIVQRKKGVEPLANSAKTEADKYFPKARVFGYHGLGISRGSEYVSQARCLDADFDKTTGNVSKWVKASTVRKEF